MTDESTRICKKCGLAKPMEEFHRHPTCVGGRLHSCRVCTVRASVEREKGSISAKERKSAWAKDKRANSPEYVERHREAGRRYFSREDVKEKMRIRSAQRREEKRDELNERRRQIRAERKSDPRFVMDARIRAGIRASLKRVGANKRSSRTYNILGFSCDDLIVHLEKQFQPGMSWENMAEWHIDHIRPLSSFEYNSVDCSEFKSAWALPNLRPLWASDNLKKQASRQYLL